MLPNESESSLTDRYQTTVPEPVRRALGLNKRDKLRYQVLEGGQVLVTKAEEENFDPTVLAFLSFLEKQIIENPGSLVPITHERVAEALELTKNVVVDINERLDPANE
mgnify:CR=1 FL=1